MTLLTHSPPVREESNSPSSPKKWVHAPFLTLLLFTSGSAFAASEAELKARIQQLEAELKSVSAELESIQTENKDLTEPMQSSAMLMRQLRSAIGLWVVLFVPCTR